MVDLSIEIAGMELKNPVMVASGTFGYGREYAEFFDLSRLGAVMVKGVSSEPWTGNPVPRIVETPSGMLNAIGLQNPGVDYFLEVDLPWLRGFDTRIIVNIIGRSVEEYADVAARLSAAGGIDALEINISCPNIKEGGIQFGSDPRAAARVVEAVKRATHLPVIPKLSPNVTDIAQMARAVEDAGADAISLVNTFLGMAIDIRRRKPVLANVFGGLSGPAIRPLAVRMVWQVYEAVRVPLIGMGGIMDGADAAEFVLAGARAVAVGTANFIRPTAALDVLAGLERYVEETGLSYAELIGAAHPRRTARQEPTRPEANQ
ncbi:MAG: dihydroorotate dehydrogenase [Firmicutes bacterium]|jgi:dihydroorotate dehydrogenase (NAD+) catalytic subunit|nr:dihydroorotate dehydrogenase [Bacillota bacterium]